MHILTFEISLRPIPFIKLATQKWENIALNEGFSNFETLHKEFVCFQFGISLFETVKRLKNLFYKKNNSTRHSI